MNNKLTIVIPTLNSTKLLDECVSSVRRHLGAIDLIVVDDGSTEESGHVFLSMQSVYGFKLIRLPKNAGQSAATNHGMDLVRTPYAARCDSDIVMHGSGWVSEFINAMERDPRIGVVGLPADSGIIDKRDRGYGFHPIGDWPFHPAFVEVVNGGIHFGLTETFRRFQRDEEFPFYFEDVIWGLKLKEAGYVGCVIRTNEIEHRRCSSGITNNQGYTRWWPVLKDRYGHLLEGNLCESQIRSYFRYGRFDK